MFKYSKIILSSSAMAILALSACTPGQNPLDSLFDQANNAAIDVMKSGCVTAVKSLPDLGGVTADSLCDCAANKTKEKAKTDKELLTKIASDKAEREKLTTELLEQCSKDLTGKVLEGITGGLFK